MITVITATLKEAGKKVFTREFVKFIIVGLVSAVLEYSLLYINVEYLGMDYLTGNLLAFSATNIVTYILSRKYVFGASSNHKAIEATLFFLCLAGGLALNELVLWTLVEFVNVDYMIGKVPAIGVTIIWNFYTRKYLVFRNRNVSTGSAEDL